MKSTLHIPVYILIFLPLLQGCSNSDSRSTHIANSCDNKLTYNTEGPLSTLERKELTYDTQGQLSTIRTLQINSYNQFLSARHDNNADSTFDETISTLYSNGNLTVQISRIQAADNTTDVATFYFDDKLNRIKSEIDYNNNGINNSSDYRYNRYCNIVSESTDSNGDGNYNKITEYSYNSNQQILTKTITENGETTYFSEWAYNDKRKVTGQKSYSHGLLVSTIEYTYENNDQRITDTTSYTTSSTLHKNIKDYDDNGNLVKHQKFYKGQTDDALQATETYYHSYNTNNQRIYSEYDATSDGIIDRITNYTYNPFGHILQETETQGDDTISRKTFEFTGNESLSERLLREPLSAIADYYKFLN